MSGNASEKTPVAQASMIIPTAPTVPLDYGRLEEGGLSINPNIVWESSDSQGLTTHTWPQLPVSIRPKLRQEKSKIIKIKPGNKYYPESHLLLPYNPDSIITAYNIRWNRDKQAHEYQIAGPFNGITNWKTTEELRIISINYFYQPDYLSNSNIDGYLRKKVLGQFYIPITCMECLIPILFIIGIFAFVFVAGFTIGGIVLMINYIIHFLSAYAYALE